LYNLSPSDLGNWKYGVWERESVGVLGEPQSKPLHPVLTKMTMAIRSSGAKYSLPKAIAEQIHSVSVSGLYLQFQMSQLVESKCFIF